MSDPHDSPVSQGLGGLATSRRRFIKGAAMAGGILGMPHIWCPKDAYAQSMARGQAKHVIFIRLSGGFRFTTAFNGGVDARYNPFGLSQSKGKKTEWGVSALFDSQGWLSEERKQLGLLPMAQLTDAIAVLPCVDHEPTSGSADGNHSTGLERYLTGYVGGGTSILSMINWGLKERTQRALDEQRVILPAFSLGSAAMARGAGEYAAFRPPVISNSFDQFGFEAKSSLPGWADKMAKDQDLRMRAALHPELQAPVDAYMQTRDATGRYAEVFGSDLLKIDGRGKDEVVDGLSNAQLRTMFGDSGHAKRLRLGLRLFHYGCPAIYLDQGGYDMHSGEERELPGKIEELGHLISALTAALKTMTHPEGGTYWDHTLVVLGSEFGRTTRGSKFNSAKGSDHGGDLATRWMSMPVFGGLIEKAGSGGKSFGQTRPEDLKAQGKVYSYRSLCKTVMDTLGCDHSPFFPADAPFDDLFA